MCCDCQRLTVDRPHQGCFFSGFYGGAVRCRRGRGSSKWVSRLSNLHFRTQTHSADEGRKVEEGLVSRPSSVYYSRALTVDTPTPPTGLSPASHRALHRPDLGRHRTFDRRCNETCWASRTRHLGYIPSARSRTDTREGYRVQSVSTPDPDRAWQRCETPAGDLARPAHCPR